MNPKLEKAINDSLGPRFDPKGNTLMSTLEYAVIADSFNQEGKAIPSRFSKEAQERFWKLANEGRS